MKRSSEVAGIAGGMAQILGAILKLVFCTCALLEVGQNLPFMGGSTIRLVAKFGFFVQDGGAHKITWHCKGDSGTRFCLLCKNVVSFKSKLADGEGAFRCNVCEHRQLDLASDEFIKESVRKLHRHKAIDNKEDFKKRETRLGFTYQLYSLILDAELEDTIKPVSQFMHDWMHCMFVQGVWNLTMNLLLEAVEKSRRDVYAQLLAYVSHWRWPCRLKQRKLHELFTESRRKSNREGGQFKCQASMGLSLYGVVAAWMQKCIVMSPCIAAYIALADLIDCLICISRGHTSPEQLLAAVEHFLGAFVIAFGADSMTPKFHWLLHLPDALKEFGFLVACFVHERKHRMLKRYCTDIRNTIQFEKSVLDEATCHQMHRLDDDSTFNYKIGLLNPHRTSARLAEFARELLDMPSSTDDVYTSSYSKHSKIAYSGVGDVVLVQHPSDGQMSVGRVSAHLEMSGSFITIWKEYKLNELDRKTGLALWSVIGAEHGVVFTEDIKDTLIWMALNDEIVRTIMPREWL